MIRITHPKGLWRWRDLLLALVRRDLTLRYKGSAIGLLWSLAHPLVLGAVYAIAFRLVIRIPIPDYPLFLLTGLLPWLLLQLSLGQAAGALVDQGHLLRKVAFPPETLVISRVVGQFIHFGLGFAGIVLPWAIWVRGASPALAMLPLLAALELIFVLGLAALAATWQVRFGDARHLLDVAVQVWFWLTPVIYAPELVPARFQRWLWLNPMAAVVEGYRTIVLDGRVPPAPLVATVAVSAALAALAGFGALARLKPRLAEMV